ncbi:zinc ribbon domain-containing protein [Pseudomonas sp. GXZC]|uniref:zinc ribbon domain-containing protein n=1 Tax=Pseudomonas sp. GXZC TaxID=3003351 RepID=UPI0022AB3FC9|nr:zinc ribbon domain-containing protein [Pseudomonas sp. GXZC]WAT32244.1 hypothetical protein OZ428_33755 [Pseudomonas sp. GXZC]
MTEMITLQSVVCPGCAQVLPIDNQGCPKCGYEDNTAGRILALDEIMKLPADDQAHTLNDVSPAFIVAIVNAARAEKPTTATLVEALEKLVLHYSNPEITHVDYRVHACKSAEQALAAYKSGVQP